MNSHKDMEAFSASKERIVLFQVLCVFLLISSFSNNLIAQNNKTFTVGSIEAKSGEKVSDSLIIEKGVDEGTFIPITIINGAKSGPVLTLVAGVHGTEYVPIVTLQQLLNEINPNELSGTVIMVHIANIPSFGGRAVYSSPIDSKNLNRCFPGKKDGTISERIAYIITNEIIKKSDYYIDLHGGEFNEALVDFIFLQVGCPDNHICEKSRMLALAMGFNYLIPDDYYLVPETSNTQWSSLAASRNSVPAITVEIGDRGKTELKEIDFAKRGVINVMRTINMLEGEAFKNEHPVYLINESFIKSNYNGILYTLVNKGQYITKGTLIGYTTDYWGNVLEEYFSPITGIMGSLKISPAINKGESVCRIAEPVDEYKE
jgi:predicted deacylase